MRTNTIAPQIYTGLKAIRISPKYKKNIGRPLLYNEILNITNKFKVPATFHTGKIELPEPTFAVLKRLKELGISFRKIK